MTYIIAEPCIEAKDASCVEVCPVDCIYEGEDQFYNTPRRVHRLRGVGAGVSGHGDLRGHRHSSRPDQLP